MRRRTRTSVVFAVTAAVAVPGVSAGAEHIPPLAGHRAAVARATAGDQGASALALFAAPGRDASVPARAGSSGSDLAPPSAALTPPALDRDTAAGAARDAGESALLTTDASAHGEGSEQDGGGGPPADAGGRSTPGVVVTAQNPGTTPTSDLRITLSAHSAKSSVSDPSCRPQDQNLRCGASLVLVVPEHAGFSVSGFTLHRVAVGGEEGGGGGHEEMASVTAPVAGALRAQVNGVAFVTNPGDTGVLVGTQVQIKMQLIDNAKTSDGDQITLTVNRFVPGSDKPPLFGPLTQTIQQVQIHELGAGATSTAR